MRGTNTAIGGGGFHHVALRSSDFDRSVDFYTRVLGLEPKVRWGEGDKRAVLMDTGDGGLLEVFAGGSGPAAGDDGERSGILHFALNTDDVDAAAQRVRDAGAEITVEPKTVELDSEPKMSIRIAFCKGPDGELIEFFQTL